MILQDFRVKTYHATRLFATCGDIVVEKGAVVSAPIRVQNLTVRWRVKGDVEARAVAWTVRVRDNAQPARATIVVESQKAGTVRQTLELAGR